MPYLPINHCRFCRASSIDAALFKYSVRHYACARCGFARFGQAFVDRLPLHQVGRLPYRAVLEAGIGLAVLERYVERRELAERIGRDYKIEQELAIDKWSRAL